MRISSPYVLFQPRMLMMIFRKVCLLLFLFGIPGSTLIAQTSRIDSLKDVIATEKDDAVQVEAINGLMAEYSPTSPEYQACNRQIGKIILYNLKHKDLDLDETQKFLALLGYWYMNKAVELFAQEKKEEVLVCCDRAIFLFDYLKMYEEMWTVTSNRAAVLREMGRYEEAITSLYSALKYHESIGNDYGVYLANSQLVTVFEDQDDFANAYLYYKKLLKYQERITDPDGIDTDQIIIDNSGIGMCCIHLGKYKEAMPYLQKALGLAQKSNISHHMSFCHIYLGSAYTHEGDYEQAEANFRQALAYAETDRSKSHLWQRWAQMHYEQKNFQQAETYYENALSLQEQTGEYHKARLATYEGLYKTYEARHKYREALEAYEKYRQALDSTKVEASRNAMMHQQLKYDYEKKELQSKVKQEQRLSALKLENERRISRKNRIMYSLILLALILCVSIFYLYKFFRQRNVISAGKANELKQKLLRTQMNPHFIFNSVDNIQSLIHNKQGKEAISYLTRFSKLTRQILENSNETYISLSEELAMTENYLQIQQLLYNTKFGYTITVDEAIDREAILLPPMLTQPFIENAIKHGLKHREQGGMITVRFYMEDEKLFFEVKDNGSGIVSKDPADTHRSMSLNIVNERLNNSPGKKEIHVNVKNLVENNEVIGAQTSFEIPYIYDH